MPWKVDRELCTGCGMCTEYEEYFKLDGEIKSVMLMPDALKDDKSCIAAEEDCPTEAIYWED